MGKMFQEFCGSLVFYPDIARIIVQYPPRSGRDVCISPFHFTLSFREIQKKPHFPVATRSFNNCSIVL